MAWQDWQGVIGALGGVTITSAVGLVTAKLTHGWQREEQRTARIESRREGRADLRRTAYAEYLGITQRAIEELSSFVEHHYQAGLRDDQLARAVLADWEGRGSEIDECQRRVLLLAGPGVRKAMKDYEQWYKPAIRDRIKRVPDALRDWDDQEKPLLDAMREEVQADLGIDLAGDSAAP